MEMIYYTVAAIFLYVVSDRILNWIEIRRGTRFDNRTLVFFVIIMVLSVVLFNLIQQFRPAAESPVTIPGDQTGPEAGVPQQ